MIRIAGSSKAQQPDNGSKIPQKMEAISKSQPIGVGIAKFCCSMYLIAYPNKMNTIPVNVNHNAQPLSAPTTLSKIPSESICVNT